MVQAVDWCSDGSVYVVDLALACCALESQAALAGRPVVALDEVPADAASVLTVSGTLTDAMVPAVREVAAALPSRPTVVAFGACACIGGPYWDSYSVTPGAGEVLAVDHVDAGCPPPPEAFERDVEEVRRGRAA